MKCRNPFVNGMHAFGCGQCMPCRVVRRRTWTHRLMLERLKWTESAFVTLSYADQSLTLAKGATYLFASLVPKELQDWLKRLRKAVSPQRVRYYAVGEYGDISERPHYHVALFGFASCEYGMSRYTKSRVNCCVQCDLVRDTWGMGNVFLGQLEERSAQYISGYCLKKMTSFEDRRLEGRYPEFARMSLRPGIGGDAVEDVARSLVGCESLPDVPAALRHGSKMLPLGRYLRRRLRVRLGRDIKEPREVSIERSKEMQALYAANVVDPSCSVRQALMDVDSAVVARLEARRKIFKQRKSL